MKVKSVGLLSALGMMLTSLTVWSLTPPRPDLGNGSITTSAGSVIPDDSPAVFSAGDLLKVEGRLGHAVLPAERENETFLMLNLKAADAQAAQSSVPLNLSLVIDRSGSMRGRRLDNALNAARGMLGRLRDGDVVSIVTYNTSSDVVLTPTTIDSSTRQTAFAALSNVFASGDTCIDCGVETAMGLLRQRSGMVSRMLLLSDGEPTTGIRDLDGFRRLAGRCRAMDVAISSIGVDLSYNERLLTALASESNGQHYFAESAASLPGIFDKELSSLVKTVAQAADVEIELAPGVQVEKVFDRTFSQTGNKVTVPMGAFTSGEEKTLLVKVALPRDVVGERAVADVHLSFSDTASRARRNVDGTLGLRITDREEERSELDSLVAARVNRADTTAVLTEVNQLFKTGRQQEARDKLGAKLSQLRSERKKADTSAPKALRPRARGDFDRQIAALDEAEQGFATPPPLATATAAPAGGAFAQPAPQPAEAPATDAPAQVRRNAKNAFDLSR